MRFLPVKALVLCALFIDCTHCELSPLGKNVCLRTETYEETVMVPVKKEKPFDRWCFLVPNCSRVRTFYEDVPKVVRRIRIVPRCCDGYTEEIEKTYCVPACLTACVHGECVERHICACNAGFYGFACDKACPEDRWGVDCTEKCNCFPYEICNKATGCECRPGWRGERCALPCEEGYYGHGCQKKCDCDHGCNHETGACITANIDSSDFTEKETEQATEEFSGDHVSEENKVSVMTESYESEGNTEGFSASEMGFSESAATNLDEASFGTDKETNSLQVSTERLGVSDSVDSAELSLQNTTGCTEDEMTEDVFTKEVPNEKMNFQLENEINFLNYRGSFTEFEVNESDKISENPSNSKKNFRVNLTDRAEKADKNETDNLVSSGKGSSLQDHTQTHFHFMTSLCILSVTSLIIFVIAAKWLIVSHRKKVKKILMATRKQNEKLFQTKHINGKEQNFYGASSFMGNPTYLLDAEINNSVPVLHTFKPVTIKN